YLFYPFFLAGAGALRDLRSFPTRRSSDLGNDVRARLVLDEWRRLVGDPTRGRALVFCVSVAHAQDMTARLNRAGIKALCVVGERSEEHTSELQSRENLVCRLLLEKKKKEK